ncbi:MAG: acetyl-CoA acetyltransferase [Burkholderiaceae bacterium]
MPQKNSALGPDRIPVIVGVGEIVDRPTRAVDGLEPCELMARALERADMDAEGGWLDAIDALDVVHSVSWPYQDPLGVLTARLGIDPRHQFYGPIGGETPIRFLHEAACRIASGQSEVAAVCGGEAEYTVRLARRESVELAWQPRASAWQKPRDRSYLHPLARAHGLDQPVFVYPLYEVACEAAWGQTPAQGQRESAELWAGLSRIAADNPHAFLRQARSAEEIATVSPSNRPIAWPYSKLMVANPVVNQGAAVIVTSLARARAAGIPEHRLVHIGPGAAANEPRDWVSRENYRESHAQDKVLSDVMAQCALTGAETDFVELYSCFPCVPKMARRALSMPADRPISVTGGLTFFGAPLNNYMAHALCAMVGQLRAKPVACGLVYGQGEFVTKHHALMLGGGSRSWPDEAYSPDRAVAQQMPATAPVIASDAVGSVHVETSTVLFDRQGKPTHGVVVGLTGSHARTLARVPASDPHGIDALMRTDRSPVGRMAILRKADDGLLECALD